MKSKDDKGINANKRLNEIINVAKKHKVISLITSSSKRKKNSDDGTDEDLDLSGLRLAMEELGPAFIKLGQLLATRPDMVGIEIADDLKKLRDNTPTTPFEEMREVIEGELGKPLEEVYSEFNEEPIGSASIGQVYTATLKDTDEKVAVKIQKPNIYDIIVADVKILKNLAGKTDKYITSTRTYNLPAMVAEFERSIFKELNYMEEVMNIQKVTKNFEEVDYVKIPVAYKEFSTKKVITMELIDGYELTELFDKKIEGIDNEVIANYGLQSFFKQVMIDGFFHADPHPGNMFITKDEKVCYIDWGMVGILNEEFRGNFSQLILLLLGGNSDHLIKQLLYMDIITPEQNTPEFQQDIEDLLNRYLGVELDEMDGIFESLMNVMIAHNIILPREFVMIGRGIILIEDTGEKLVPGFNITSELEKFAKKMIKNKFSKDNIISGGFNYIVEIEHLIKDLPDRINATLNQLENGDLEINLKHGGLDDLKNILSLSLILAALIVGTALVLAATILASAVYRTSTGLPLEYIYSISLFGFILSLIIGIYIVFKYLRK